ncbi:hypothetical protein Tco_1252296 [Tanacetum coccineum]
MAEPNVHTATGSDYVPELYTLVYTIGGRTVFPVEEHHYSVDSPTAESTGLCCCFRSEENPERWGRVRGGSGEHLAPGRLCVVVPNVDACFPILRATKPVIAPPSMNVYHWSSDHCPAFRGGLLYPSTRGEVEVLLAMILHHVTHISLLPPLQESALARVLDTTVHIISTLYCRITITSTTTNYTSITTTTCLPLGDLPESELPPHKRLCLSTLGPRYKIGESSTAKPIGGRGIDYGFVSVVDANARRQGISKIVEEEALLPRGLGSAIGLSRRSFCASDHREQVHETRFQMQQAEMAALQEDINRRERARQPGSDARAPDHQEASRDADSHI